MTFPKPTARQMEGIRETLAHAAAAVRTIPNAALQAFIPHLELAQKQLIQELKNWEAMEGGADRYTAHRHRAALAQINGAIREIEGLGPTMASTLTSAAKLAAATGVDNAITQLAGLNARFTGAMVPIDLDRAQIISSGEKLLLRKYPSSAARYAGDIEKQVRQRMAVGVLKQHNITQVTETMMKEVPAIFKNARSNAERLVRTETMEAYNAGHQDTLIAAHKEDDEVKMRWDGSYDRRRCVICGSLDGSIVEVAGKGFSAEWKIPSGATKTAVYQRPPAHPNCRCVLVPWMDDWPDTSWNTSAPEMGEPIPEASMLFGPGTPRAAPTRVVQDRTKPKPPSGGGPIGGGGPSTMVSMPSKPKRATPASAPKPPPPKPTALAFVDDAGVIHRRTSSEAYTHAVVIDNPNSGKIDPKTGKHAPSISFHKSEKAAQAVPQMQYVGTKKIYTVEKAKALEARLAKEAKAQEALKAKEAKEAAAAKAKAAKAAAAAKIKADAAAEVARVEAEKAKVAFDRERARVRMAKAEALDKAEAVRKAFYLEAKALLEAENRAAAAAKAATDGKTRATGKASAKAIATGEAIAKRHLGGGANDSAVVTFAGKTTFTEAVFKPVAGEVNLRDNVPKGTYYKREAAASNVAKSFGVEDLVPKTVARDVVIQGKVERGSLQELIDVKGLHAGNMAEVTRYDGERMRIFDFATGNSDRHGKNVLYRKTGTGTKPVLIDNGLAFPLGGPERMITDRQLVSHENHWMREVSTKGKNLINRLNPEDIATDLLRSGIEERAVESTLRRVEYLKMKPNTLAAGFSDNHGRWAQAAMDAEKIDGSETHGSKIRGIMREAKKRAALEGSYGQPKD